MNARRSQPVFLMCPPTYFTVAYEINPWMDKQNPINPKKAMQEFDALVRLYKKLGCRIEFMKPQKGLPDMVFTANGAVVSGNSALIANFRYPERRPETQYFSKWFRNHGWKAAPMPAGSVLEGQGEAFFVNGKIFAGYGFRANRAGHQALRKTFRVPVISLKLVDSRWYHLDTCFCPLRDGVVMYYPGAFDTASRARIIQNTKHAITVSKQEALDFVCNSVPIGNILVTGARPSPKTRRALQKIGYQVLHVSLDEFKKSGGGARCLTLNLNSKAV